MRCMLMLHAAFSMQHGEYRIFLKPQGVSPAGTAPGLSEGSFQPPGPPVVRSSSYPPALFSARLPHPAGRGTAQPPPLVLLLEEGRKSGKAGKNLFLVLLRFSVVSLKIKAEKGRRLSAVSLFVSSADMQRPPFRRPNAEVQFFCASLRPCTQETEAPSFSAIAAKCLWQVKRRI